MKKDRLPGTSETGTGVGQSPESGLRAYAFAGVRNESRMKALMRTILRILFIIYEEFFRARITLRASALTYAIILSMVPLLALSTAVLKGLGSDNQLKIAAYKFIDQLGPAPDANPPADKAPGSGSGQEIMPDQTPGQDMTTHLRNAVDMIFDYVDRTNFAALGAFGIVGLLLTVILMLSSVEDAMNAIWHSRKGRPLLRKVTDYLGLLILLPISINVALAGGAVLESPRMLAALQAVIHSAWVIKVLLKLLPFLFVTLSLMIMYLFFPTVRVQTSAAFSGAVFAAIFWFIVLRTYIVLQIGVAKYNAIYGSFATVPLLLIWIHLGWTIILLGATLAFAVQNRNRYHLPGQRRTPLQNLQLCLDILKIMYGHFSQGQPTPLDRLIRELDREQEADIQQCLDLLLAEQLIHRVEADDDPVLVPASPPQSFRASGLVQLVFGCHASPTAGGEIAARAVQAAEETIRPLALKLLTTTQTTRNAHAEQDAS
ncbi:YihY/virulence factor BrkB family protein [Desulfolithobacter sp.]